ncbi:hypothetical protein BJY04DRAFT_180649 [Aspergillus karnatakaensis]|uniref:uncharacterized protein n=1 Tax=Aspergillus karnatakaensis TaxID=1810916 RepID=UPI003CCDF9FE
MMNDDKQARFMPTGICCFPATVFWPTNLSAPVRREFRPTCLAVVAFPVLNHAPVAAGWYSVPSGWYPGVDEIHTEMHAYHFQTEPRLRLMSQAHGPPAESYYSVCICLANADQRLSPCQSRDYRTTPQAVRRPSGFLVLFANSDVKGFVALLRWC